MLIQSRPNRRLVAVLLIAALLATALAYWPSTRGGFVFDDYPNIVANNAVHLQSLDWESLREAALASPSPVLIRPLAMLSFGIDWYLYGGNPFAMKLVNLAIHLINGLLLFALLRRITRYAAMRERNDAAAILHADLLALCVTAAWLLAPINFSAVAYVVQRMESLCQTFVLAGLWGYVVARQRMLAGAGGFAAAAGSIVAATVLGALAKESAVLLPLYALIVEYALFRFAARDGRTDRRLPLFYVVVLAVPAAIAAVWTLGHVLQPGAWANRPFTLAERLLTEPRILLHYVHWSLLPTPKALALYHDQIPASTGLFDPWTTLPAILCLAAALCAIPLLRKRRPLAAIGLGWFLAAHLLTGTVIPLELVFEHRNYFASIGLYLLLFSLLLPHRESALGLARAAACFALLALFGGVTLIRALDWSSPVAFAISEADKNPDSPRTAYELGRTYVVLSQYKPGSPLVPLAQQTLERAATMPGADALPDQALLMIAGRMHQPTTPAVWQRMQKKLAAQPASAQNIEALHALTVCAIDGDCDFPRGEMVACYLAVLRHSVDSPILATYASYAINVLRDGTLALDLAQEGLRREPQSLQARRNLMLVLQTVGRHDEAVALYEQTLRDVPGADRDRPFAKFSRELLNTAPSTTDAKQPPGT